MLAGCLVGGGGLGLLDGTSDCSVSGAVGGALLSLRVAAAGAVDTLTTGGAISTLHYWIAVRTASSRPKK